MWREREGAVATAEAQAAEAVSQAAEAESRADETGQAAARAREAAESANAEHAEAERRRADADAEPVTTWPGRPPGNNPKAQRAAADARGVSERGAVRERTASPNGSSCMPRTRRARRAVG